VLVKIEAAGVNFVDIYQRTGLYRVPLPFTLARKRPAPLPPLARVLPNSESGTASPTRTCSGRYAEYAVVSPIGSWRSRTEWSVNRAPPRCFRVDCALPRDLDLPLEARGHLPGARRRREVWACCCVRSRSSAARAC